MSLRFLTNKTEILYAEIFARFFRSGFSPLTIGVNKARIVVYTGDKMVNTDLPRKGIGARLVGSQTNGIKATRDLSDLDLRTRANLTRVTDGE